MLRKLFVFLKLQALSFIFPVAIFITLALTKMYPTSLIHRYDLIFTVLLLIQFIMVYFKLETQEELKVICIFHVIGLVLEVFKVDHGAWCYPEDGILKFAGVPLYSGFMYASVASYIIQVWKRFDLQFIEWPQKHISYPLIFAIYLNFFTNQLTYDFRWFIIISLPFIFKNTVMNIKILKNNYNINSVAYYLFLGFLIWIAENIATYFGAWKYPYQMDGWQMVDLYKVTSWLLLVIITITIVANMKLGNRVGVIGRFNILFGIFKTNKGGDNVSAI